MPSVAGAVAAAVPNQVRYTLPGAWLAVVLACLSFTPSLLPRTAVFQGVVAGINAAIGYGLGVLLAWVWREFAARDARPATTRSWRVFAVVSVLGGLVVIVTGQVWQHQIRDLMGMPQDNNLLRVWIIPILAALVFFVVVQTGRGIRWCYRRLAGLLGRVMGRRAARALGLVVVAGVAVMIGTGVLWSSVISAADQAFSVRDLTTDDNVTRPTDGLRSGGPGSLITWDLHSAGWAGRTSVEDRASGRSPTSPVPQPPNQFESTPAPTRPRTSRRVPNSPSGTSSGPAVSTGTTCW